MFNRVFKGIVGGIVGILMVSGVAFGFDPSYISVEKLLNKCFDGTDTIKATISGSADLGKITADAISIDGVTTTDPLRIISSDGTTILVVGKDRTMRTLSQDITGLLAADTITVDQTAFWGGGRTHYADLATDLDALIASSRVSAGDTIKLASGTYTIVDDIDVTKALNIVGQGMGKTTISCATASKNVFDVSASNVRIADLSITHSGAGTFVYGIRTAVSAGHIFENLEIAMSGAATYGTCIGLTNCGATIRNVKGTVTNATNAYGVYGYMDGPMAADVNAYIYNTDMNITGVTTGYGLNVSDAAGSFDAKVYAHSSTFVGSTSGMETGGGVDSFIYAYNCTANGGTQDVKQATSSTLTLYDTVLVNGTTSGTITYGGTVVTGALGVGGANTTGNIATLTQNSDTIGFLLDGTDAYTKWSDGISYLMTDEGTNTLSAVYVKGKGTGAGRIGVMDGSNTNYVTVFTQTDGVCATSYGSSVTEFVFNEDSQDVDFRVESDTMTHAFFVDGATGDVVGQTIAISNQHDEIGILLDILTAPKAIVGFTGTGATTTTESGYESGAGRTWTYSGGLTTDKIFQGSTYVYSFDGTDSYMSTPDTADMSFGDGTNDTAMSVGGWVQIVNTAGVQAIISKEDDTTGAEAREWYVYVLSDEKLRIGCFDESANVVCTRVTDAALSEGWHHFVITKDATGGATAMANTVIYVDGVAVASTAAENASYVAMENLATVPLLGAIEGVGGTISYFFTGDMGRLFVTGEALSAATIWKMYEQTRGHYNK